MQPKNTFRLWLFLIVSSVSAFIIPLIRFKDHFLTRDWALFDSFSYFVRSCWIHYKAFPLHNPYLIGGMDMLADPQSKVLSPLALLDVLFPAPYANLLSLVVLSVIGGYGMIKLLRHLQISESVVFIVTFLYMHASWFTLHFSEGHVIFGAFQLFSWVLYFTLRINEARFKVYLAATLAFMVLDGGMYAFIYSVLFIVFAFIFRFNGLSFKDLISGIIGHWKTSIIALVVFIGLACGKIVPLLAVHSDRIPIRELIVLDFKSLVAAFFFPFQYILLEIRGASFHEIKMGFHEIGAYLGVISFIIIIVFLVRNWNKHFLPYLAMILFFLWIGSGVGHSFNPWRLFQEIPIVNNAHIQTRALFIPWLLMLILLAYALDYYKAIVGKFLMYGIVIFLISEALFVSNYPFYKIYQHENSSASSNLFDGLLENTRVDKTVLSPGSWGSHYKIYKQKNTATKTFMNPAINQGRIRAIEEGDYRGEVYVLSGQAEVEVESYTPKGLILYVHAAEAAEIQVNTNYILNWTSDQNQVIPFERDGLLTLKVKDFSGRVVLNYRPVYFLPMMILFLFSLSLLIAFILYQKKLMF